MSELINGKEALIALANGESVLYNAPSRDSFFFDASLLKASDIINHQYTTEKKGINQTWSIQFKIEPRTITINGIEVPALFEPKLDDVVYYLTTTKNEGYTWGHFHPSDAQMTQFGAWRTESEIKQVVAALRSIFK